MQTSSSLILVFYVALACFCLVSNGLAGAAVSGEQSKLPLISPIFGSNMVMQRGKPNTFWGWSKAGQVIRLEIAGSSATATTGVDGRWEIQIDPPPTGGPYTLTIEGPETIELHNILVGDVWLCGGQSNMHLGLGETRNGEQEIKSADHPLIRLYMMAQNVSYGPSPTPKGEWKVCSPTTVAEGGDGGFSAVAYFFAERVQKELHVPIGLIEDCVGGTPAETWMSPETIRGLGDFDTQMAAVEHFRARAGRHMATTSCIGMTNTTSD